MIPRLASRIATPVFAALAVAGCDTARTNQVIDTVEAPVVATVGSGDGLLKSPITDARALFSDRSVDLIVQGAVTSIEYRYADDAVALTGVTVAVDRSRGKAASTITAWETGGLIPVSDLPAPQRSKAFGDRELPKDGVIDFSPSAGADRAKVGDQVVLFLRAVKSGRTAGDYYPIGGTLGRFTLNGSGDYVRDGAVAGSANEARPSLDRALLASELAERP